MATIRLILISFAVTVPALAQQDADTPPDVQVEPLMHGLQVALEESRWLDAVQSFERAWQLLFDGEDQTPEVQFAGTRTLQPGQHQLYAGAREQLRRLFRAAPEDFQQEYQRQYDASASGHLQQALRQGDRELLLSLIRRYELCHSAGVALRVLTADALAHGDNLSAAMLLQQLIGRLDRPQPEQELLLAETWLRAGYKDASVQTVGRLIERLGDGAEVTYGSRSLRLPEPSAVTDWLDRELLVSSVQRPDPQEHFGGPKGSWQARPAVRLTSAWECSVFRSAGYPEFDDELQHLERRLLSLFRNTPVSPSCPVVTKDLLIFQAIGSLQAVDRQTGALVWESGQFNRQLLAAVRHQAANSRGDAVMSLADLIVREMPRNHLRGQMVTDGEFLYSVEETTQGMGSRFTGAAPGLQDHSVNMLRVREVATGRLRGQAGGYGSLTPSTAAGVLDGMYFLGAPLLLQNRILILAEDSQGIHLLDLRLTPRSADADGELEFHVADTQMLSVPRYDLSAHPVRRLSGISPVFSDGLILCHGCDEQILGLSAADLSVLWVHRYRGSVRPRELGGSAPVLGNAMTDAESMGRDLRFRPHDSAIRMAGGRILLMPRDSDQLVCLDAASGREEWSLPRGDLRYLVAASESRVVVAGSSRLAALDSADGRELWNQVFSETEISGQPVGTERLVCVPTRQGRMLIVDLASGRLLLDQSLSTQSLGNLLSVSGQLFTQNSTTVACWNPQEPSRDSQLAAVEELLLTSGPDAAVPRLQELASSAVGTEQQRTRSLLIQQLLESLRLDYDTHRSQIPLLKQMIAASALTPLQISDYVRSSFGLTLNDSALLSEQWADVRRVSEQKNQLERLIGAGLSRQPQLTLDEVVSHVSEILPSALSGPNRLLQHGRIRLKSASQKAAAIQQALSQLDETSRRNAIEQLAPIVVRGLATSEPQQLPDRMFFCWTAGLADCLLPMKESVPDVLAAESQAAMVLQLLATVAGSRESEDRIEQQLRDSWMYADVPVPEEWPSQALRRQGPGNDPVGRIQDQLARQTSERVVRMRPPRVMPSDAHQGGTKRAAAQAAPGALIPLYGMPGVYRGWQFVRQVSRREILAIDDQGRRRWEFDPTQGGHIQIRPNRSGGSSIDYAVACGRLLILRDGGRLFAMDGMNVSEGTPLILWSVELNRLLPGSTAYQQTARSWERTTMYDRQPDALAPIGPVTQFGLTLFRGQELVVLNPWTGDLLWQQGGLSDDTRLAADGDQLCLISESTSQIQVRNLRDGSVRRSGRLPDWWTDGNALYDTSVRHVDLEAGTVLPWRIVVEGTRCLMFTLQPEEARLISYDLAQVGADGPPVTWEATLPADCVFSNICDGLVATLSNGKQLEIRQISDGTVVVNQTVPPANHCARLYLRKSDHRLLVLTWVPPAEDSAMIVMGAVPVNGPMYALNPDDGSVMWTGQTADEYLRILQTNNFPTLPSAPLLVLLHRQLVTKPDSPIRASHYAARVLDVSDGRVLFEEKNVGRNLSWHVLRFDDDNRFTVNFDLRSVEFDFAEEQAPPDESAAE